MAEFVEKRIENMLPELEKLKKLKMFDKDEIQGIAKKVKDFEYKIQRHTKSKEDYGRYIQYEMDLYRLIEQRIAKLDITQNETVDVILVIKNKINNLYTVAIDIFKDDIRFWSAYIKFCKHFDLQKNVSDMMNTILQIHQDKDKCWHIAGHWELEENKNKETARQFFHRGLQIHPNSQLLYIDIFKLELEDAETNKKVDDKSKDDSATQTSINDDINIELQKAYIIYQQAIEQIKDVKFIVELLNIMKEHKNTEKLQNKIVSNLIQEYIHEPLMWDTMARRELEGLVQPSPDDTAMEVDKPKKITLRDRLKSCNKVYKTAVKKINTKEMWLLYIECLIEINKNSESLSNFKRNLLKSALSRAHKAKKLAEKHYLYWINMLIAVKKDEPSKKELKEILTEATETMPKSASLWHARLKYLFASGEKEEIETVFLKATQILGGNAFPLWELKILNVQIKSPEKIEEVFQAALQAHPNVAQKIKPSYIEWLVLRKDIQAARKVYDDISLHPPFSLELHKKMLEIELVQPKISLQHGRKCHELATLQFGKNNTNVWMEYIKFERKHGEPMKACKLTTRAVQTLKQELIDSFFSEYSLMQSNPNSI